MHEIGSTNDLNVRIDEVKAVVTLRSGKELRPAVPALVKSAPIVADPVTPRPKRVYGMCNRMCTKGFLNYFSAIIEFLKVVLRVTL